MRFSTAIASLAAISVAAAITGPGKTMADFMQRNAEYRQSVAPKARNLPRAESGDLFLTNKTEPYSVDGANFPDVNFDLGESYAGTLPISANASDPRQLFFWFFPSTNPAAEKEIVIWFTGGPGCSSMVALFQENGPFLWQPGVYEPFANPYSWTNLTNVVWVDQPYGVGLSQGTTFVKDDSEAAAQFIAFWKHFVDLFDMQGYKIYITGESYAGMWVPYTAYAMLEANDTSYYNLSGISIMDPVIGDYGVQSSVVTSQYLDVYNNIININESYATTLKQAADDCGYTDFIETYLTFPPPGPQPDITSVKRECEIWNDAYTAATYVNPCFNVYHMTDHCPFVWNQVDLYNYAAGPTNYFNRSDVQAALNVPTTDYTACESAIGLLYNDNDPASAYGPLPAVIEATNNVIVGNGLLDFLIISNGTLLVIQNMTWNGAQGFQTKPSDVDNFWVPYDPEVATFIRQGSPLGTQYTHTDGGGLAGVWHTERGLTWVNLEQAGHETPEYVPGASFRHLEFLLGRIDSLNQTGSFTTYA